MARLNPCEHDWMEWGSKRICVRCNKAEMRKDLPEWDYRQNGSIVKGERKKRRQK